MGQKSILIVDDDKGIREVLKMILQLNGYSVHAACNGQDGIDILERINKPCVILLDLMMPVMDGGEFLQIIRQKRGNDRIPIVVLTAFRDKARDLDVDGFLSKPYDLGTLLETIKKYCV